MLHLNSLIGKGATRECYAHPSDPKRCIKIMQHKGDPAMLRHELEIYKQLSDKLKDFICRYTDHLIETDKGPGLESELIINADGTTSRPLIDYVIKKQISSGILSQLETFCSILIKNNIFFYDFNLMNFVVQELPQKQRLVYIDMKSYQQYKPWTYLKLERFFSSLAAFIMKQRIRSMYKKLNIPSPF